MRKFSTDRQASRQCRKTNQKVAINRRVDKKQTKTLNFYLNIVKRTNFSKILHRGSKIKLNRIETSIQIEIVRV